MKKWYSENLPLKGKKCFECYHNTNRPCDPCPTLRCLESGKTERDIVPGLPGSDVRWIELFSYPMKDPNSDKTTGVVEFVRNITKRKQAEEELQKSEIQHKALIKNIPGMVYRAYSDWSAEIFSGSEIISGYTTVELKSKEKNWLSIVHPDDMEIVYKVGSEFITKSKELVQTYRIITKSGNIRWVEDRKTSLISKKGEFIGIDGIVFDITDRKQAEEALKDSETKYRSMMEAMKDPIYICSPDFRVEYMNPAMIKRIGRDATGENCFNALHDLNDKCPWCVHHIIQQETCYESDIVSPKDNRSYHVSHSPIVHEDGSISKMTIYRDTTDFKKMETQLRQAQKMEAIGTLAGGIAHDFNNILFPMFGYLEMILEDVPRKTHKQNLKKFLAGQTGRDLVKQILAFSRQKGSGAKTAEDSAYHQGNLKLIRSSIPTTIKIIQDINKTWVDSGGSHSDSSDCHEFVHQCLSCHGGNRRETDCSSKRGRIDSGQI